jgi:O-antigen ligase
VLTRRSVAALQSRVSDTTRTGVAVATIVLLISGQGFRYSLGLRLYAVVCVAIVLAVAACFPLSLRNLRVPRLLYAYVGLAAVGVAWSATRPVTALAVLVLIATTYVALSIVSGMSDVRFMEALYRGLQVSLFGAVLFELVVTFVVGHPILPLFSDLARLAPHAAGVSSIRWSEDALLQGGPIQGFVGNRNPTATIALFAAIAALVLLWEGRVRRFDAIATLVTAIGVLLLTRSATVTAAALYVSVLTLAAFAIRAAPTRLKRPGSVAVLVGTALAVAITIRYRLFVFGLLGRSVEASHRTTIWEAVVDAAERRPQGWGFVGYWPVWEQPYAGIIGNAGVFASHAHNAFLDSWLQMGIVGLALLVALVVQLEGNAWRLVEASTSRSTYLPLGWVLIAAGLFVEALTESRMLVEGGWFLLVALLVSALRATDSAGVSGRPRQYRRRTRSHPLALRSAEHGANPGARMTAGRSRRG